jgi:hypothetical protein
MLEFWKKISAMEITDYESLLAAAREQEDPQRLLFTFLKAFLPKDPTQEEARRFAEGQGGQLKPVMCVDKGTGELSNFADLVIESEKMDKEWDMVLVACLAGNKDGPPSDSDVDKALKMMSDTVANGEDLSRYLIFDREGQPVQFGPRNL